MTVRAAFNAARRRALRDGVLPNLDLLPKKSLPIFASALTMRLGHVYGRWIDRLADAEWGLTGPRLMLVVMLYRQGELAMGEAADIMDVTPRAITRLVDGLEKDGFVTRQPSKEDKRSMMLDVTPKAKELAKRQMPKHEARVQELFSVFTDAELKTMIEFHHRLQHRLHTLDKDKGAP